VKVHRKGPLTEQRIATNPTRDGYERVCEVCDCDSAAPTYIVRLQANQPPAIGNITGG
jgi:hypothetical protein